MTEATAITASAALAAMVDELGDLDLELAPLKAKFARLDVLRAAIRGKYRDASPAEAYQAHGLRWSTLIGPCGNQSQVDVLALFRLVGEAKFLQVAGVSLKAITEKCGTEVLGAVVKTTLAGPRQLTTIPRVVETEPRKPGRKRASR